MNVPTHKEINGNKMSKIVYYITGSEEISQLNLKDEYDFRKFSEIYKEIKNNYDLTKGRIEQMYEIDEKIRSYFPQFNTFLRQGVEKFPDGFEPKNFYEMSSLKHISKYLTELHEAFDNELEINKK